MITLETHPCTCVNAHMRALFTGPVYFHYLALFMMPKLAGAFIYVEIILNWKTRKTATQDPGF